MELRDSPPAPLVQPAPELTAEARARAHRQIILPGFGDVAQRRLQNARVLVIGAGGLGSATVPYLAGAGVGRIGIIDNDDVELSNLHRQIAHGTADLGRPKVDSLAESALAINPAVTVVRHRVRLTAANALELFREYDLVIDGSDNFPTRYLANDAAELAGIPLVWGAILQYSGQVSVAWHAHGAGYRDLFPVPPEPGSVPSCSEGGVIPALCGVVGSLLAAETMKLIAGLGDPLIGRVLTYDALTARTREITLQKNPAAARVTELIDYDLFCGLPSVAESADHVPPGVTVLTGPDLVRALRAGTAGRVIDVRTAPERTERRVANSDWIPGDDIEAGNVKLRGPVTVYCERDPRSIRAATALVAQGVTDVAFLRGGVDAFARLAPDLIDRGPIRDAERTP